ncbi:hypothetical protein [Streptomyces chartreusis]|uniref:hypothetical protein n=1 Tax=Streptomyces chartreusis TaxID=1969 RepID=UPI003676B067
MTDDSRHDGQDTLEEATAALHAAEQSVSVARRRLSAAIVAADRSGEPVAQIALRTGKDVYEIRNLLAATGTSRRALRTDSVDFRKRAGRACAAGPVSRGRTFAVSAS